jgi:hypothetical protein
VRLTVSIDDDKTIPLATLAEFITEQNIESVLLEGIVESLDTASVEALCGEKHAHGNGERRFQRLGTDTRKPSQPPVITSSASTTLRILLLTTTNPVTSGPSKMFSASTGRTSINRISQPPVSTAQPRSATVMLLITATASSNGCRRQPPQPPCQRIRR